MMFQCPAVGTGLLTILTSSTYGLLALIAASRAGLNSAADWIFYAFYSISFSDLCIVRAVGFTVFDKEGAEGGVIMSFFQTGDGAKSAVIHDNKDGRNVFNGCCGQNGWVLTKAAITDERDDYPVSTMILRQPKQIPH